MGLNLEQDIEALFEVKMREFCTWCSKHYALTKAEMITLCSQKPDSFITFVS